jgi:hypothetical protein
MDFKKLVDSTVRKEAFEELVMLGKYYKSVGDISKMKETTFKLECLVNKNANERNGKTIRPKEIILKPEERILATTDTSDDAVSVGSSDNN